MKNEIELDKTFKKLYCSGPVKNGIEAFQSIIKNAFYGSEKIIQTTENPKLFRVFNPPHFKNGIQIGVIRIKKDRFCLYCD